MKQDFLLKKKSKSERRGSLLYWTLLIHYFVNPAFIADKALIFWGFDTISLLDFVCERHLDKTCCLAYFYINFFSLLHELFLKYHQRIEKKSNTSAYKKLLLLGKWVASSTFPNSIIDSLPSLRISTVQAHKYFMLMVSLV